MKGHKKEEVMKKALRVVLALAVGLALVMSMGCAGPKYSGFMGGCYKDLQPGPEGGAKMRWLQPGVDFSKYNKLMIDSVVFYYAPDSDDKSIDAVEMKELTDAFNQALVDALKDKYPIVAEPGPDVVRLKIAITNIKKSKPVISGISSIVPIGLGLSIIKKGATGSWSGSGSTSTELMALNSMDNSVIAIAVDEETAGFFERFTRLGSAKDAFKFWAGRIRIFMDEAHGIKK
jgi:hypothetical protein